MNDLTFSKRLEILDYYLELGCKKLATRYLFFFYMEEIILLNKDEKYKPICKEAFTKLTILFTG